jgi:hypothetical protein
MTDRSTDVLSPLPRPGRAIPPGGWVPSDDDLLERALAFSGSYVSDDGHVTVRRSSGSLEYSGARFTGYCAVCARTGLTPPSGEPLTDVRAAAQFVVAHHRGEAD